MSDNIIQYGSRTFGEIRTELISYIKQAYPEIISDFTDSSVGAMLIEINAGVTNNLSVNTDRAFQETQLDNAQQRMSVFNIAKNMGFNIPSKKPSVTIVDFTVTIPVLGDRPDSSYYPIIDAGAQIVGGGKTFESIEVIDFNSPYNHLGDENRSIIPVSDSNGIKINYKITKREIVVNGTSNVFKQIIFNNDIIPFFTVTLPDQDVTEIESIILKEGTNNFTTPSDLEFYSDNNISGVSRYYEVDYLAQQKIFLENKNSFSTTGSTKSGRWFDVSKKFIKEYNSSGYCTLTFGSGDNINLTGNDLLNGLINNNNILKGFLNNNALGERLKANQTLYIKYRNGGGISSNIGSNVLTQTSLLNINVNGSRSDFNNQVKKSLTVNNPIPAIGGNDGLSIEQIKQLIKYNYSSQYRDVTLNDYLLQVYKMPGKFGSAFRANAYKDNNKVIISMIGINSNGKLNNSSNSTLKENIVEYISQYRMINDYIEIKDGKIYNLGVDVDVYVDNISNNKIANSIISAVNSYFDVNKFQMNSDIFLGDLQKTIINTVGVINIISLKLYNKVGNGYSNNVISQEIKDNSTGEINIINNTIYSDPDSMFEILYPEKDISVFLRKNSNF
jgi:hypothetical protein